MTAAAISPHKWVTTAARLAEIADQAGEAGRVWWTGDHRLSALCAYWTADRGSLPPRSVLVVARVTYYPRGAPVGEDPDGGPFRGAWAAYIGSSEPEWPITAQVREVADWGAKFTEEEASTWLALDLPYRP